eukprot:3941245-Rhodomonas_salina.1
MLLRACYEMCGTELLYAATRLRLPRTTSLPLLALLRLVNFTAKSNTNVQHLRTFGTRIVFFRFDFGSELGHNWLLCGYAYDDSYRSTG